MVHKNITLGVVRTGVLDINAYPPEFDRALEELILSRRNALSEDDERRRQLVREMLRNGRYKPTGRSKPASEYLIREAGEGVGSGFPRINAPVDICNYVSLKYLLPVSLWDLEKSQGASFVFRVGRPGESYVFNAGGQVIELEDLIVGCAGVSPDDSIPMVTPVKDSLRTKTNEETKQVVATIYTPSGFMSADALSDVCREFAGWLSQCGTGVETAFTVIPPGSSEEF